MVVRAPAVMEPWTAPAAPALGLHLSNFDGLAEDVLQAMSCPFVGQLCHDGKKA